MMFLTTVCGILRVSGWTCFQRMAVYISLELTAPY